MSLILQAIQVSTEVKTVIETDLSKIVGIKDVKRMKVNRALKMGIFTLKMYRVNCKSTPALKAKSNPS